MTKESISNAFMVAEELYDLFILEAMITPNLQKIIDHALSAESRGDLYRKAWLSGVTWSIIQSKRVQEIVDKLKEEQSNN